MAPISDGSHEEDVWKATMLHRRGSAPTTAHNTAPRRSCAVRCPRRRGQTRCCAQWLRPPTARRPRPTSAPGSVPGTGPAESVPTAAAACQPTATRQGHVPTRPAALPNAAEAIGSSGTRADEPANPVSRLDVAGGLQLTHVATNHAARYPALLDKGRLALRITGSRQGNSLSDGPVVSRSLHRFHLVRRRPGMRAAPSRHARGARPG